MKRVFALAITIVMMFSLTSCSAVEWLIGLKADRTYTLRFNANGGEGEMDDYLVESGDDGWLPKCTFTKEGYECVAWGLDPEGKKYGTQIDNLTFNLPSPIKSFVPSRNYNITRISIIIGYIPMCKITHRTYFKGKPRCCPDSIKLYSITAFYA